MIRQTTFSIIVPVYNTKKNFYIECINSLLNLNYDDYEIIVVDDGSNTETKKYLLSNKNDKINIITHKTNKGLAQSRKTGLRKAKGEYSIFVDSDDLLDVNSLNEVNSIINKFHSEVIIYSLPRFTNSIDKLDIENHFFNEGIITKDKVMSELLSLHTNSICEKCAKTELMKRCFDDIDSSIIMGEDLQQSTNLILNADSFYYTSKHIYYYRINYAKRDYYDQTNLNDMNFTIPTYKKVFIERDGFKYLLPVYKLSAVNAIIYRTFKLCKHKNYKELINKLLGMEIVKTVQTIDKKTSFAQEMMFYLIIHKKYHLIKIFAFIYNKTNKEF